MNRKVLLILITMSSALVLSACGGSSGGGGGGGDGTPVNLATLVFDVDYGAPGGANGIGGELVYLRETTFTESPGGQCSDYKLSADSVSNGCTDGACNLCPLNYSPPWGWETNAVMQISGMAKGLYTLQIRGIKDFSGTLEVCFEDTAQFSIDGKDLDIGTVLVSPKACSC